MVLSHRHTQSMTIEEYFALDRDSEVRYH